MLRLFACSAVAALALAGCARQVEPTYSVAVTPAPVYAAPAVTVAAPPPPPPPATERIVLIPRDPPPPQRPLFNLDFGLGYHDGGGWGYGHRHGWHGGW